MQGMGEVEVQVDGSSCITRNEIDFVSRQLELFAMNGQALGEATKRSRMLSIKPFAYEDSQFPERTTHDQIRPIWMWTTPDLRWPRSRAEVLETPRLDTTHTRLGPNTVPDIGMWIECARTVHRVTNADATFCMKQASGNENATANEGEQSERD